MTERIFSSIPISGSPMEVAKAVYEVAHAMPLHQQLKFAESHCPVVVGQMTPRSYQLGSGWPSPKYMAIPAVNAYLSSLLGFRSVVDKSRIDGSMITAYMVCARLAELQVPTYFVSPALLEALRNTDLPDLKIRDITWPMDAVLFVLPTGALQTPEGNAQFIAMSHFQANRHVKPLGVEQRNTASPTDQTAAICVDDGGAAIFSWSNPTNDDPLTIGREAAYRPPVGYDGTDPKANEAFCRYFTQLGLQLLLALSTRPDLVEHGAVVRPGGHGRRRTINDLWSPNVMGRTYQAKREELGGTHASPRVHWRRGHWRLYEAGEGKPWRKTQSVLIEPVMVVCGEVVCGDDS